jgi:hypothetical protein
VVLVVLLWHDARTVCFRLTLSLLYACFDLI